MGHKPIETRADIAFLMDAFYQKALAQPHLAPHFEGLDFEHHLPRIIGFWAFVLLDEPGFTGNVFDKHANMNIDSSHFQIWVGLFHETVDAHFVGAKADLAKQRASLLGWTFAEKMKSLKG